MRTAARSKASSTKASSTKASSTKARRAKAPSPSTTPRRPPEHALVARAEAPGAAGPARAPRVTYGVLLRRLKARIHASQTRAALAVNRELLTLYWAMGRDLVDRRDREGWGTSIIERLAHDLQVAFPGMQGFSARNLWRMRAFYVAYGGASEDLPQPVADLPGPRKIARSAAPRSKKRPATAPVLIEEVLPQAVADLPWGHHVVLIEKIKDDDARRFYAGQAVEHGWTRTMLLHQLDLGLHRRHGAALTNFHATLASPQLELARHVLKDPYTFDFLTLAADATERDIERGLITHVRDFLLELGVGFAFVGSQVHLEVGGEDYYVDLLFFHLKLRCFVVIDLKTGAFKPEHAGKMSFYLSAVDDVMRTASDQPTIGLILCREKNKLVVEYALRDMKKPIGVSAYRMLERLPRRLEGTLPTVAQLEAELNATPRRARR